MVDCSKLSRTTLDRLGTLYDAVRGLVYADASVCNNWVRRQYFEDRETGFPVFVDDMANAMAAGEISWYDEDEDITQYCFSALKVADFLYRLQ